MQYRTDGLLQRAKGLRTDESSVNFAERSFSDEPHAQQYFEQLRRDLLDISHWNRRSGLTTYDLFDSNGDKVHDVKITPGAFIKITLYGSGKPDWVRVDDVYDSDSETVITVRPTYDPTGKPQQTGKVSHFFTNDATNNFCALRREATVFVYVIGLNEKLNTGHTEGIVETARNAVVANVGHYLGIQSAEWTKFCNSFLFGD